ncbi:hypothetical protein BpHYR1_009866 [Brachionus plicatilis]|uniref:Uncharacterized protein n=1 Tax=Brachionus plicatilis TaxID=10195 RepID=A0A3M7SEA0_BRAPC|nr:hypothetical protein BpHYR1_009866 [Brachionus plicatilis]
MYAYRNRLIYLCHESSMIRCRNYVNLRKKKEIVRVGYSLYLDSKPLLYSSTSLTECVNKNWCHFKNLMASQKIQVIQNSVSNRLFELSERYVRAGLSHSVPLVVRLVEEYRDGFESRYIEYPTPLSYLTSIALAWYR